MALIQAAKNLKISIKVLDVRTRKDLKEIAALIIPGGESTTIQKLCEREGMLNTMRAVPAIFGTCAGAIMLAKSILHKTPDQKSLERIDIEVDRNAYGRQTESFEKRIQTSLGPVSAVFIRAPKITKVGKNVKILAQIDQQVLVCEEKVRNVYSLAACFHPELTTTLFHEYFLKKIAQYYFALPGGNGNGVPDGSTGFNARE